MNASIEPSCAEKVCALRLPSTYGTSETVEAIETHFSWVFLVGDYAYKLKKPIQVERMDFRKMDDRERSCREELRLNRRLAPQVYLDVVPLCWRASANAWRIGGANDIVDWLVKMRRLPAERMLDAALKQRAIGPHDLRQVARVLADFFVSEVAVEFSPEAYISRMRDHVEDVCEQLRRPEFGLNPVAVATAHRLQSEFIVGAPECLAGRAMESAIIEGHGDLRPEHIFLGSSLSVADSENKLPACAIDCLEFDRDLRIVDPLEELAFLQLECDRLQARWAADVFIDAYRERSGISWPDRLFRFYYRQRALNRAKIAVWHLLDEEVAAQEDWRALASTYLQYALEA